MNWTVLGARGTIGEKLSAHLRAAGDAVFSPGRGEHLYSRPLGHVIYAIGLTADFRQRPYDTVDSHVRLLAQLLQNGNFESLLYLSSTRVYARVTTSSEDSLTKVLSKDPSDLYNISKLMGESLCLQDARSSVRVARLSNVVCGDDAKSANFLPSLVREARSGRIVLQTAMDSSKDYIHIDDVVELLPRIATKGHERLYNVASGIQTTHEQWTTLLAAHTGCVVKVVPSAPTIRFVPIDISRIRTEFDFHPRPVLAAVASILK
jgi:nucleoside-diphosphate-sugar epimerase